MLNVSLEPIQANFCPEKAKKVGKTFFIWSNRSKKLIFFRWLGYESTLDFQTPIQITTGGEYLLRFWAYFACRGGDCSLATDTLTFNIQDKDGDVLDSVTIDKDNFDLSTPQAWQSQDLVFVKRILPGEIRVSRVAKDIFSKDVMFICLSIT